MVTASDDSLSNSTPINIGYFLVIVSCILAASLMREQRAGYPLVRFEVYRNLQTGGMRIETLLDNMVKEIGGEYENTGNLENNFKTVIISMLEEDKIVCREGMVHLAERKSDVRC